MLEVSESTQVMWSMDSTPTYCTALWAIIMLEVSESPAGLPAGCHVTSINNGFPDLIRSNRERRFTAPALVRGGKNSSEKNLSLESILALIFSASVASKELNMRGDVGLEVTGVVTGDTELMVHRMVEEAERRQQEAERLRTEVKQARESEKEAKNKLIEFLNISVTEMKTSPTIAQQPQPHYQAQVVPDITPDLAHLNLNMEEFTQSAIDLSTGVQGSVYMAQLSHLSVPNLSSSHNYHQAHMLGHNLMTGDDMEALSLEIEREKFEYLEKSKHLQDQLQTFKSEIDDLKLDEKVTELDKIHSQQRNEGENKYSTIQKVKRGSTSSRVAFFEEL